MRNARQRAEPVQIKENDFTPVAQDDLQIGMPVKDTGQDQAYKLDTGFVMPPQPKRVGYFATVAATRSLVCRARATLSAGSRLCKEGVVTEST